METSTSAGNWGIGRPKDPFIYENFTRHEKRGNKTRHWVLKCNYCSSLAEHRDARCLQHLASPDRCPRAPQDARNKANSLMVAKAGLSEDSVPALSGNKRKLDEFLEQPFTKEEVSEANVKLFRFIVHANIPFIAAKDDFFLEFAEHLRPSYNPPSPYTLTHTVMAGEESRVYLFELDRLKSKRNLTIMVDGWDDRLWRSVYGVLATQRGDFPSVLQSNDSLVPMLRLIGTPVCRWLSPSMTWMVLVRCR